MRFLLAVFLLANFLKYHDAHAQRESCAANAQQFFQTYQGLYSVYLNEYRRDIQTERTGNVRSESMFDQVFGGMISEFTHQALDSVFMECPITIERIISGVGPLGNSVSLSDFLFSILLATNTDNRKLVSEMTSISFLRWLDRRYDDFLYYQPAPEYPDATFDNSLIYDEEPVEPLFQPDEIDQVDQPGRNNAAMLKMGRFESDSEFGDTYWILLRDDGTFEWFRRWLPETRSGHWTLTTFPSDWESVKPTVAYGTYKLVGEEVIISFEDDHHFVEPFIILTPRSLESNNKRYRNRE
ncbi:MAG: hypothetical protein RIE53_04755 [Rhodothermales bacterium]